MKLLEYMAMGRAVAAPRLEGIADLVDDGDNGLLFAAGDARSLQATLGRLMNDAALRLRLGRAARRKVEDRLNWRHNAQAALETVSCGLSTRPVNSVLTSIEDLHS